METRESTLTFVEAPMLHLPDTMFTYMSGDAPKQLTEKLKECGFEIVSDPLKVLWVPDQKAIEQCREYGSI